MPNLHVSTWELGLTIVLMLFVMHSSFVGRTLCTNIAPMRPAPDSFFGTGMLNGLSSAILAKSCGPAPTEGRPKRLEITVAATAAEALLGVGLPVPSVIGTGAKSSRRAENSCLDPPGFGGSAVHQLSPERPPVPSGRRPPPTPKGQRGCSPPVALAPLRR